MRSDSLTPPDHPSRRTFLRSTSAALGTALAAPPLVDAADAVAARKVPMRTLGRTGARVSLLGIGCAHFRYDRVTREDIQGILDRAGALGVNYLDIAPNYGDAEDKLGPVLEPARNRFFLVTKTEEPTYDGTWKLLRQSMKRLRTDHLDVVHVHNLGWEKRFPDDKAVFAKTGGTMAALREAKRSGVIRFIGASGHLYPSRFRVAIESGEIDVLMCAVNFIVRHVYNFEDKVFASARKKDIGLVAMKVLGGRTNYTGDDDKSAHCLIPAEHYRSAMRYALSIKGLSSAVIGVEGVPQLDQAAQVVVDHKPFTPAESKVLRETGCALAKTKTWAEAYGAPLT